MMRRVLTRWHSAHAFKRFSDDNTRFAVEASGRISAFLESLALSPSTTSQQDLDQMGRDAFRVKYTEAYLAKNGYQRARNDAEGYQPASWFYVVRCLSCSLRRALSAYKDLQSWYGGVGDIEAVKLARIADKTA